MKRNIASLLLIFICLTPAVHAELLYRVCDIGTLATEKSEARSMNQQGWIAGKYFDQGKSTDFLWSPEMGLQMIAENTDPEVFPRLNNLGNVTGIIYKPAGWLSSAEIQTYSFNHQKELVLSKWVDRKDGRSIVAMNDMYLIMSFHTDVFKSGVIYVLGEGRRLFFRNKSDPNLLIKQYPTAINDTTQVLYTQEDPGIFGFFATHNLKTYDMKTNEQTLIANDKLYYGVGINNSNFVIARNKKNTEGFYGSNKLKMISLGNFIPKALNNLNEIVGKKDEEILLRRADGTMINLSEHVDLKVLEITDVWAINDKGQILVTAKISGKSHAILLDPIR